MCTWIDTACTRELGTKSQTGGVISVVLGAMHCKSHKKKLNSKSSSESDLVRVIHCLPSRV